MTYPTPVGRGRSVARRVLLALSTALATSTVLLATPVVAQSTADQPTPPRDYNLDQNGVDLVTGKLNLSSTDLTIGSGEARLSYSRNRRALGYDDEYDTALNVLGSTINVAIGGTSDTFTSSAGNSTSGTGATLALISGQYHYTTSRGVQYLFDRSARSETYRMAQYRAVKISFPDGRVFSIDYETQQFQQCTITTSQCVPGGQASRPSVVSSNDGYRLVFTYLLNNMDGARSLAGRYMTLASATITNAAEQYCTAASCPPGGSTWASVQYAWNTGSTQETRTGPLNRVTVTTVDASGRITGLRLPGETTDAATITYDANGRVHLFKTGVGTWTYTYVDVGDVRTTTVESPTRLKRVTTSSISQGKVKTDRTGTGGVMTYEYDAAEGRLTKAIAPEGNHTTYTYDAVDNVTSVVTTRKGGGATLSTSAVFPANCSNLITCHLPTKTTDVRGQVTDYEYDPVHGGVTRIRRPAPSVGATRPETRFGYQQLHAWLKNASGVLNQAASPIWKLTSVSECSSGEAAACVGTVAETRTEIAYGTPGTPNNLLPTSITVRAGDNSVSSIRAMRYDQHGNVVAEDGPLPGAADTTTARYNLARELVGIVSPDPDGAGPLKHRAARVDRDPAGRVTTTEVGTVAGQAVADWTTFSALQTATSSYDPTTRLKSQDVLTAGGVAQSLVQYGYDADGRPRCTVARIGLAASADPCQQAGNAATGYDQLAETVYGPDGRVAKTRQGDVDTATVTYTLNGQVETVTDGESNRTTYDYDGFDRLYRTRYPVKARGANASITVGPDGSGDYEQLGYDGVGDLTTRRLRDSQQIGYSYDLLGRMKSKDLPDRADVTYAYDDLGRLLSATDTSGHKGAFTYDALGRKLSEGNYFYKQLYGYDQAGRRIRTSWSDAPGAFYVDHDYLVTGEMSAIREQGAMSGIGVLARFGYDDLGQRTSRTMGNGTVTTYGYDPASWLAALTLGGAGGSRIDLGHNPVGQITTRKATNTAYAWTGHGNADRTYLPNGLNQHAQIGGVAPTYDARGNLTSLGTGMFEYTSENLLWRKDGAGTFYYDPLGRLDHIQASDTLLAYDGSVLTAEYATGGVLRRRYVYGPGTDEPLVWYEGAGTADRRWLDADERGSITRITNDAGAVVATNSYDEYGRPGAANIGRFGYTGQKWIAELGLYDYKARMYAPQLGRFMQTDPIVYGDGMNLYGYVGGDPVNRIDPTGLCSVGHFNGNELHMIALYPGPCGGGGGGGGGFGTPGFGSPSPSPSPSFGGGGGGGRSIPAPTPKPEPQEVEKPSYCTAPLYRLSSAADTGGKVLAGLGVAGVVGSGIATLLTGGTALPITGPIALFSSRIAVLGAAIADLGAVGKASAAQGAGLSATNVATSVALGLTVGRVSGVFAGGAKGAGLGLLTGAATDEALNASSPDPCG